MNLKDKKELERIVSAYLEGRPGFFSLIRPQEAYYFCQSKKGLKAPILDFGCGDGFFAAQIFYRDEIEVGLDIVESRIEEAGKRKIYRKLTTYHGDEIPFPTNHFGSVFSNCVLEHLPELEANLKEIYRVLKPRGKFFTTVMADKWEEYQVGSRLLGKPYRKMMRKRQEHFNLFSQKKWRSKFEAAGFKVLGVKGYLNQQTASKLDLAHYFSIPSLISYRLTGKWVILPGWHRPFKMKDRLVEFLAKDIETLPSKAAALFFELEK